MEQRKELIYLRDEEGGTPLHYAATTGFVKGVRELLDMPTPTALEWNSKGHLPIHLACKWGHVEALKKLLKHKKGPQYPGALLNQKGQNILHIAAKNGRDNVVDYLKSKDIDINARDNDGNTPLHLAAKYNFPSIIKSLTQNKRILVNILSKEGTARDTLWKHSEVPMTIRQWLSDAILDAAGAKCSFETRNDNNRKRGMGAKQDVIKQNSNTLMLVAVLIVTVAFQAAVTAPTYNKDNIITSVLGIFVLFNSMAMYFSTFGSLLLIWAQFGGGQRFYDTALYTVLVALLCMTFAFIAATGVALDIYTEPILSWTLLGIAIFVGLIFYVLIFHFCHLSFLVFKTHKSAPVPLRVAKPSIFMNILIWFYKNSPKEKDYKKLQNSANSQQLAMANQNENQ